MEIHIKKHLILFTSLICLFACNKKTDFELTGELENLSKDSILILFDAPFSKLDTIPVKKGKFTYKLNPDTITLFRLISDSGKYIPIFANKSWRVSIKGTFDKPEISGEGPNNDYQEFLQSISGMHNDSVAIQKEAEKFITSHPYSFASAYILDQCFAQISYPDTRKLYDLISPFSGEIKDCIIVNSILKNIQHKGTSSEEKQPTEYINYFTYRGRENQPFVWNTETSTYTLINFWASWDQASVIKRDSIYNIPEDLSEDDIRIINISLDIQKDAWLKACKKDTPQWFEACDFKSWTTPIISNNRIQRIPTNFLINRNRRIIATDLFGKELFEKIRQLKN